MSFNRSGYIGRAPGDSSVTIAKQYFQPSAIGKTFTFASGYDVGYVDVYRNGVKLINVLDYAATDGSTVVLDTPVGVGSTVQVVAYKAFNVANVKATELSATVTGTNINLSGTLDVTGESTLASATVSDLTDNRVVIAGADGVLEDSSNLTFNGSTLGVTGTVSATTFSGSGSGLTGVAGIGTLNVRTNTVTVSGVSTFTGAIDSNATTDSTSSTTGAITAAGGVGIAKDLFVGDAIDVTKDLKVGAAATITGALSAGAISGSTGTFSGAVNVDATTDSTSATSGALIVDGGLGVAKNVYIGAGLSVAGTLTYEDVTNVDSVGVVTAKSGVNVSGGQLLVGSGVTIGYAGVATFSGTSDVHLTDGVKLKLGDSSDLHITHNGSNSFIEDSGTGALYIDSNHIIFRKYNTAEVLSQFVSDGAVSLYYDNSAKLATTNDGTVTTGIATATGGLAINADSKNLSIGASEDLKLFHDGSHSIIHEDGTGALKFVSANSFQFRDTDKDTGDYCINANIDGAVSLYYNGNSKFATTNDGVSIVGICTATGGFAAGDDDEIKLGNSEDLIIKFTGTNSIIDHTSGSGTLILRGDALSLQSSQASAENYLVANSNAAVELYHNNFKSFQTDTNGAYVYGPEGDYAALFVYADEGDDNADQWMIKADTSGNLTINTYSSGSWVAGLTLNSSAEATLTKVSDSKGDVRDIIYQNKTSSYTLVASDAGKAIHISTGGVTINNSIFSAGNAVTIINNSGSNQTITQGSGVTLYNTGDDGSTGNKTLKGRGMCTVWFSSASVAYITGNFD